MSSDHFFKTQNAGSVESNCHDLHDEVISSSQVEENRLLRKIDFALIPWLSLLYLLSFLDRTSIGNAKLYGLVDDLHLSDKQYLLSLTIFCFSYAIFEVPSNVILRRLRPSVWLSLLAVLWGAVMTLQGVVTNFGGLIGSRWCLGMFEAGLFPGVNYYLSCWYKRSEFGIRAAIFFAAASISGAFGGLLSAAISKMDGFGGKAGWAWIFILEGLITVIAGVASFWMIPDFPKTANFLSRDERILVIQRLQNDSQLSTDEQALRWVYICQSFTDWKTWITMVIYAGCAAPVYSFSLFLPSIINQLGFTATTANLMAVPVYTFAGFITITIGYCGDRWGNRGYFNIGSLCLSALAYIILIVSRSPELSYVAVFIAAGGIFPVVPNTIAWISNNVEGSYKRSVSLAMAISFGNINCAVTSNVYRAEDKPRYALGHGLVLTYIGLGILSSIIYRWGLKRENNRRDCGERDEIIGGEDAECLKGKNGRFNTIAEAKSEKGDAWSGYRYVL